MAAPSRPPTWLIYPGAVATLLLAAFAIRPHTDAPAPPPPLPSGEGAVLNEAAPFDALSVQRVHRSFGGDQVTAFAIGDGGVWLAPAGLAQGCAHPTLVVGGGQGVAATARPAGAGAELAVFTTRGGAPALPLAADPPRPDALAYAAGFPHGRPAEVAMRLLGPEALPVHDGARPSLTVLAWAVIGRTDSLGGDDLTGLAGAPVLDASGRVVGVVIGEQPRRGRVYSATLAEIAAALRIAGARPATAATGQAITRANYGMAADDLRRTYRVVSAICATG